MNSARRASLAIKQLANSFFGEPKLTKKQDHEVVGGIYDWMLFDKKYGSEVLQDTAHKLMEEVCSHPVGLEESETSQELMATAAVLHDACKRKVPNLLRTVLLSRDHYHISERVELKAVFAKFELASSVSEPAVQLPKNKQIRCFTKQSGSEFEHFLAHRRLSLDNHLTRQGMSAQTTPSKQESQVPIAGSRPTGLQALRLTELYTLPEPLITELVQIQRDFQPIASDSLGYLQPRDPKWLFEANENLLKKQSRDLHELLSIQKNLLLKRISTGRT